MRVADYAIEFIYQKGAHHIFTLTGGGAMFLNDAVAAHRRMKCICHHHEQAAAMAAEAYAKVNGGIGAAMLTSGPGSTNAITGLLGAWQDSVPCIFLSSQTKRSQMSSLSGPRALRQFGVQEVNIIPIVSSLTKYATAVLNPEDIKYEMEKAYFLATSGRPGPVWIEIPSDVASADYIASRQHGFTPAADAAKVPKATQAEVSAVAQLLAEARRPVIVAGGGIRLSGSVKEFRSLVKMLKIPVVVPYMGLDLLEQSNPYYIGTGGTKGQRAANMVLQEADLLLVIGSRLAVPFTGHEYDKFAPMAKKIVVDIDPVEHAKETVAIDRLIVSDAKLFIEQLLARPGRKQADAQRKWATACRAIKHRFARAWPVTAPLGSGVNLYEAIDCISASARRGAIFTTDAGVTAYVAGQTLTLTRGQRAIIPGCTLTMGYNLPAVIGIWAAQPHSRIICITGDGSFQMNIHELQVIAHHRIPVSIFVMNNNGYLAIRTTQKQFFDGRLIGEGPISGISFPDTAKISAAYGLPFVRIGSRREMKGKVQKVMDHKGPVICEVLCPEWQEIVSVSSKKLADGRMMSLPLNDMAPFLSAEEMDHVKKVLS